MAANSTLVGRTFEIKVKTGVDQKGKDVFKKSRFNTTLVATDDQLLATANALATLMKYPLASLTKDDKSRITNN